MTYEQLMQIESPVQMMMACKFMIIDSKQVFAKGDAEVPFSVVGSLTRGRLIEHLIKRGLVILGKEDQSAGPDPRRNASTPWVNATFQDTVDPVGDEKISPTIRGMMDALCDGITSLHNGPGSMGHAPKMSFKAFSTVPDYIMPQGHTSSLEHEWYEAGWEWAQYLILNGRLNLHQTTMYGALVTDEFQELRERGRSWSVAYNKSVLSYCSVKADMRYSIEADTFHATTMRFSGMVEERPIAGAVIYAHPHANTPLYIMHMPFPSRYIVNVGDDLTVEYHHS